jgi:hypothetical protein
MSSRSVAITCALLTCLAWSSQAGRAEPPEVAVRYEKPWLVQPDGSPIAYAESVATVQSLIGFPVGQRAVLSAEIVQCFKAWDGRGADGARAKLVEHGKTWEGRPLVHLIVSSARNLGRLDEIQRGVAKLYDGRSLDRAAADKLIPDLPAIAWLGFSIHGDETSGADAAVQLAYHLIAARDPNTTALLEQVVVIIDPNMNPDGRDRFLKMIAENRASRANVDHQSLLHTGYWPRGRTNHYGFDLNRDWLFATQPETQARIAAIRRWNPQLFVDAHEMSPLDTYLFAPSREPYNPHQPASRVAWNERFARDQAAAFDRQGWLYYTGEWNEGWYPGYSDSYSVFRGAVGILYEQARYAEDGIRQLSGETLSYRQAVHHQFTSAIANLETLAREGKALLHDFATERRALAAGTDPQYNKLAWVIEAKDLNPGRARQLADLLALHGIEVGTTAATFTAPAVDRIGQRSTRTFPAGSWLISARQPEARLAALLFEFDPRLPADFLQSERRELLRTGSSRLYDLTAWGMPILMDLPCWTLESIPTVGTKPLVLAAPSSSWASSPVGWIADGADDRAPTLAARLMDRGVQVRLCVKSTELAGKQRARGSVVVTHYDNRSRSALLESTLREVSQAVGLALEPLSTGLGPGSDNSDLGSEQFRLLVAPRIAIVTRGSDVNAAGEVWFEIDRRLGLSASLISSDDLGDIDLRRYNVLVIPDGGAPSSSPALDGSLKQWVEQGGTLIALDRSAARFAGASGGLQATRNLAEAWGEIDQYEQQVLREALAPVAEVDVSTVHARKAPTKLEYPWSGSAKRDEKAELERRDRWQQIFMPFGAAVAGRADDRHWLTVGTGPMLPVLWTSREVLVTKSGAQAPVRVGVLQPDLPVKPTTAVPPSLEAKRDQEAETRPTHGWSTLPPPYSLDLRLSGLLWPEASARLASSAYLTREPVGSGQVILFASSPLFRAATTGTARLFQNAVVFGPGLGSDPVIAP